MFATLLLLAQDPAAPPAPAPQPPGFFDFGGPGFMFAVMGLAMVFLFVLPARRQRKEQEAMLASMKAGSKVVLSSGVVGVITKVHDDGELTIRSDESKLRVLKSAVISVRGEEPAATK